MTEKNCKDCMFYVPRSETIGLLDTYLEAAVCKKKGYVFSLLRPLGTVKSEEEYLQKTFAEKCTLYAVNSDSKVSRFVTPVAIAIGTRPEPIDQIIKAAAISRPSRPAPGSCKACKFLMPTAEMLRQTGIRSDYCQARGILVTPGKEISTAKNCAEAFPNDGRPPLDSKFERNQIYAFLDADYAKKATFTVTEGPKKSALVKVERLIIEPSIYPSDAPVSEGDAKAGIRAWRKVTYSRDASKFTFLPIFETDIFGVDEQKLIPKTGDELHPELYFDHFDGAYSIAVGWIELDEIPILWGPAGSGKSNAYAYLAWMMNLPFYRFSITGQTDVDDLAGKPGFNPEVGTFFQQGRFVKAWQSKCIALVDEPNTGPPEVWQFFRPLFDASKTLVIDQDAGAVVERNAYSYVGLAANPAWDVLNFGANIIGDADASRLYHINVPTPSEKIEREIISEYIRVDGWELTSTQMHGLIKIAKEIRSLSESGTIATSWGLRHQVKVARLMRWFTPSVAYRRAVTDYLEPRSQEVILQVVKSYLGD